MNKTPSLKKVKSSIFFKLSLVFVGTAVIVVGLVFGMIDHYSNIHDKIWMVRNMNRIEYGKYLANEVGTPPDPAKAESLAKRIPIAIRVEGSGYLYESQRMPGTDVLDKKAHHCVVTPAGGISTFDGRLYIRIKRDNYTYLFSYDNGNFFDERPEWGPLLIAVIMLAFLINYFFIRKLLKPLEWLSEGVHRVQEGDFKHEVKESGSGELADLTHSFNQMTGQIREMLRSKEQLMLDVSHELRSPLTRMKLAVEIDDEHSKDEIRKNIRDLESMISELLESARLDTSRGSLNLSRTHLPSLIGKVAGKYKDEKPGIKVGTVPENLSLEVDPARIETVLKNVVENALKYSHHQSNAVEIHVSVEEQQKEIHLRVRDYGYGIPDEEKDLVFEPFYRVDKSRVRETGGYGLGLALCKKIMLAHEGNIEVVSALDSGTTVLMRFKMPLTEGV